MTSATCSRWTNCSWGILRILMLSGERPENVEVDKALETDKTDGGEGYFDVVDELMS